MLLFCSASGWHEDVPRSSSPISLEWDEKKYVVDFVRRCFTCHKVKAEYQMPIGFLQPLEVAEWKWEHIMMDFVTHLPWTLRKHEAVWVIMDRLTKSAHFLAVRMTFTLEDFYRLYI